MSLVHSQWLDVAFHYTNTFHLREIVSSEGEHGAFSFSKIDAFTLHIRSQLVRGVDVQGIKIINAADAGKITVIMITGHQCETFLRVSLCLSFVQMSTC